MIPAHKAFDVQTTLARITRLRVDTRQLDGDQVQYQIGFKWTLSLDEHDLQKLYNQTDSDHEFRQVFDQLKPSCLAYNAMLASR